MPTGTRRRRAGRVVVGALLAAALGATAVGIGGMARPEPAGALPLPIVDDLLGGVTQTLEGVVGTVDSAVRAQLPADPKIYGAYTSRRTPERCTNGNAGCIDTTIADMTNRFDSLVPSCHHSALFSLLYLRVTQRYKEYAETPGMFDSVATVNREDAIFYDLYGSTFAEWRAGHPEKVPPIWRLAYATADARQAFGTGDLLLGMAAHILRDLPFALWRIQLGERADHLAVNAMLRSVYTAVVDELAAKFDPLIQAADVLPGSDVLVVDAIATWRDKAWTDAQRLIAAGTDQSRFQAVADQIESSAWAVGLSLYLATRYPVQALTVTRDAYCAGHWSG
jgi:hypothetical protein